MRRRPALWIALALVAAGCRRPAESVSARDSTFVAALIELRRLPAGADTAARAAVMRRHRTTADSLEAFAAGLARDPIRAAELWRRIEYAPVAPATPIPPPAPPAAPPRAKR